MGGAIAAGHPETARAGAAILRAGGNAVDAAIAAVCVSLTAESGLTSLGGGGYMLVAAPGGEQVLLDFFVEAPGRGADVASRSELLPVTLSFGDAVQVFNVGPASVGVYGLPAGICEAARRFGSRPLAELVAPGAAAARAGVALTPEQAYVVEILAPVYSTTAECRALHRLDEGLPPAGCVLRNEQLGDTLDLLGEEGERPFYEGEIAAAVLARLEGEGSLLTARDLAAYRATPLEPLHTRYRGRDVLTTPPPSAGGILIAYALALLERSDGAATVQELVAVMEAAQAERTAEFLDGLADPEFVLRFAASRLGGTTHISVLDGDGMACSVTCTNGEGSGILVPGSGIHLNNILGEQDLNPLGFHRHPPGRRLPSMMSPTVVMREGAPELVIGSGGSNRIRSAILQTVVNVLDRGMAIDEAVAAPRLHFEDGVVYAEPGIDLSSVEATGHTISRFRGLNLFFGGVHAVQAGDPPVGGGDPRRGGTVIVA